MQNYEQYYIDLGLDKSSSTDQITQAYRYLALKYHPQLQKENTANIYKCYCRVAEAYEVLSDMELKTCYDRYGEEALKSGIFDNGKIKGGYAFSGDADRIFETFFGTKNPFQQLYEAEKGQQPLGSLLGFAFDAEHYASIAKNEDLVVDVECTLNELYNGAMKTISYTKKIVAGDGKTVMDKNETKQFEVRKGFNSDTVVNFPEMGHQAPGIKNSDLIFRIKESKHNLFKRKGNDLVYYQKISLADALSSQPVNLQTLDGRKLHIPMDQIISPTLEKIVIGEGLPIQPKNEFTVQNYGQTCEKGNLIIKFNVVFPQQIDIDNKERIIEILEDSYAQQEVM